MAINPKKHSTIVLLNLLAVGLFATYLFILTNELRARIDTNTYWLIISKKFLFFLIPVYFHNLILVRLFFDKRRVIFYIVGVLLLIITTAFLHSRIDIANNAPWAYFIWDSLTDLILGAGVLSMYRYVRTRDKQQKQELLQRQSELKLLRAQLDQHFLFNSLNTIYSYTKTNPELAGTLIERLSELLRYQLEKSKLEKVSLQDELDFVNNYLLLQEQRFSEQTSVNFTLEGEPQELRIAPMILIPFIENSFKHGNLGLQDSFVDISIVIKDQEVQMKVTNSFSFCKEKQEVVSLNIGLENVKKRLDLLYPNHSLNFAETNHIFKMELNLPLTD